MMRMVVYVACSPNASPKNRQTSVLTSQALERISRTGLDTLPDDLIKEMDEGGKKAISMLLDLLYKRISLAAKSSEQVLY